MPIHIYVSTKKMRISIKTGMKTHHRINSPSIVINLRPFMFYVREAHVQCSNIGNVNVSSYVGVDVLEVEGALRVSIVGVAWVFVIGSNGGAHLLTGPR